MTDIPRRLVVAALALAPAACSGGLLGGGSGPSLYSLTALPDFPPNLPELKSQLLIEMPDSSDALNSRKIALRRNSLSFDYFADSNWTDNAPAMVQTLLVDSFAHSGRAPAVARDTLSLRGDFMLRSELRHFEADYAGAAGDLPVVRIELGLMLVRLPDRSVIGSRAVTAAAKPGENRVPAIVAAFDQAMHEAIRDTIVWTLTNASKAS
jgi:cholesterol transport system auxiliary component